MTHRWEPGRRGNVTLHEVTFDMFPSGGRPGGGGTGGAAAGGGGRGKA